MAQLGRLHIVVQDGSGNALSGVSVEVRKQGATIVSGGATSFTVNHPGRILANDNVAVGTGTTVRSVASQTDTNVTVGAPGHTGTADDDRLTVTNNLPTLYNDIQGAESKSNPLTTDATGEAECWVPIGYYDVHISGGSATTELRVDYLAWSDSPGNVRYADKFASSGTTGGIQEAIDNLPSTGGTVILSPITYTLTTQTVTISGDDVVLQGSGWGTIITTDDATGFSLLTITGDRCNIRDLKILSSRSKTAGNGIQCTGDDCHVINVFVQDMPDSSIVFQSNTRCVAERCRLIDPGDAGSVATNGILFSASTYGKAIDNWIDHSNSDTVGPGIFAFNTSSHILIQGNQLKAVENGIRCGDTDTTFITIDGNSIEDVTVDGIRVSGNDCIVSNNIVDNAANTGIGSNIGNRNIIIGNQVTSSGNKGIQLTDTTGACNDYVISGNLTQSNTGDGIKLTPDSSTFTNVIIIGNFSNGDAAGITVNATGGACTDIVITGNLVKGASGDGITTVGGTQTRTVITNNTSSGNTGDGFEVGAAGAASTIQFGGNLALGNGAATHRLSTANWTYSGLFNPSGLDIASAATIAVPGDGLHKITGTTDITTITAAGDGVVAILLFTDANPPDIIHGNNIKLAGAANFSPAQNEAITLACDGANWVEASPR